MTDPKKPQTPAKTPTPFFAKNLESKKLTVRTNILAGEEESSRTHVPPV
jgi:hypothetical protein